MMFSATAVLALLPVMLIMTSADPDTLYFRPVSKLSKKEPASAETVSSTLKEVVCKDSRYRCPDGTTCCPISTGYGCCPYPSAVCCKDNSTCCPDGYTCDDQKKTCVKGPLSINKGHKFDARFQAATPEPNKKCPDKKGSCPRSATCCKLQTGDYGCCPIQHAVCCSDHEHCCPENHKCDVAAGTCLSSEGQAIDWVTKVAAMPIMVTPVKKGVNKACPGGGIVCPDSSTCCQLASGQYGCCPYQNADCCSDHLHCCPEGMKCDVAKEMCRQDDGSEQPWGTKLTAKPAQTEDATCPDMTSCSVGTTCCQMDDGGNYGCCPMTDGVCCQDKQHCCPKGMTCNLGHGTCEWNGHTRTYTALPVFQPTPTGKASSNDDINCPDKKSTCPSGTTCCQMQSGWYGCCPMLNAVCCSDHLHCCQKGETCDVEKGLCKDGDKETPWHQKQMATPAPDTKDVKCDDQYSCTDGTTCCKQGDTYACCPMPKAVCCDDQIHCCPSGYTCDTKQGTCTRGYEVISMTSKIFVEPVPPTPVYLIAGQSPKSEDIKCPDGSTCEDTSTCCAISSSAYACCPMKEADKVVEEKTSTVLCPDHRTVCPSGNTCCGITGGQYGCCPFPEATCCSDETNCCPHDYTCTTSSCIQSDDEAISVPWKAIIPATVRPQPDSNVVCPDKKTQCPSGATCCPIDPSGYGCCPFENNCDSYSRLVVDEGDNDGSTCEDTSTCCAISSSAYACFPMKEADKVVEEKTSVVLCPDHRHECPPDTTCCLLTSGYGCCPFPEATCCSDKINCCPHDYTCTTTSCIESDNEAISVPWKAKIPATVRPQPDSNVVCPDKKTQCPSGATCCPIDPSGYGCCPFENPLQVKNCDSYSRLVVDEGDNDGSTCEDTSTCCAISSSAYACCPMKEAVCCSDHLHCCPNGETCDVSQGMCKSGDLETPWQEKQIASAVDQPSDVQCDDPTYSCPDETTCCKQGDEYACCPMPKAVCCKDQVHCCPNGYKCGEQKCTKGDDVLLFTKITSAITDSSSPVTVLAAAMFSNVKCGDGSECPADTTCCKISESQYGCCPMPKAVCCSDNIHCCPNGYTCDTEGGRCNKGEATNVVLTKISVDEKTADDMCPDKNSSCPTGTTCCKMISGGYGCCAFPKAVCCSDHLHCCPNGETCDVSQGMCKSGDLETPWQEKQIASAVDQPSDVQCDDPTYSCPDETTCCKQGDEYACCPMPKAVCCKDQVHCCPNGYKCGERKCTKGDDVLLFTKITSAITDSSSPVTVLAAAMFSNVKCGDGSECPADTTCCKISESQYGCCPMPKAVCCSDNIHCCPNGYTCDTEGGRCNKGEATNVVLTKISVDEKTADDMCPDKNSSCPTGTTCCKMISGGYGCCAFPKAVCCNDKIHCCPENYKCGGDSCQKEDNSADVVPWKSKIAATVREVTNDVVCPDKKTKCQSGQTCCALGSGYGCCPMEKAVCCADKIHCCPNGYKCEVGTGACTKSTEYMHSIPWSEKVPALPETAGPDNNMCPDQKTSCDSGTTCCKMSSGGYGCCPYEKAVCCSDGLHCCPAGMTCDVAAGKCNSGTNSLTFTWDSLSQPEKVVPQSKLQAVKCKDGNECPWGQTCCELASGKYGCCPLPNATCCSDKIHCCPTDSKCDTTEGKCVSKTNSLSVSWNAISTTTQPIESTLVPCDDGSKCPDDTTCCEIGGGKYGCCPFVKAVCCSDHSHCCPHGMTCDVAQGRCASSLPFDTSIPAHTMEAAEPVNAVICPDHQHECPDHTTCCLMADRLWGCCPFPQAICCADHEHCCPPGYTCEPRQGICQRRRPPSVTTQQLPIHPAPLSRKPDQ